MYLKKLTLAGFKSFADPTELEFHTGTTGIVGPNGCGKSNVVDAFRWVLGERSAKELRGQEMMDVIFKGTSTREPLGRAEVSLLFDNEDGTLPLEFAEIEVTRRLFRSGESEYLINGRRCRLKDVRALFSDTGIATEGYSILEQGAVDLFLHSNPEERRALFEEAAGISRFKRQAAQALRQLERTDGNLARLRDILREVERRVHSVKIQAGKAKRWLEDRDQLLRLRAVLAAGEIGAFRSEREALTFRIALLDVERELLAEMATRAAGARDGARRAAERAAQTLAGLREEAMRVEMSRERIEQRRGHIAESRAELSEADAARRRQMEELEQVTADYRARRGEVRAGLVAELAALRALRTEFDEVDGERRRALEARTRLERALRAAKERSLSCLFTETRLANERSSHEAEDRGLAALRERREREGSEFAEEEAAVRAERTELGRSVAACRRERELAERERALLDEEAERRSRLLGEAQRELAQLRDEYQEGHARLRFLEGLEERLEGVGQGAQRLLELDHPIGRDVLGLLAGCIEAAPEVAPLVDLVLGRYSEAVVLHGGTPLDDRARMLASLLGGEGVTFCQTRASADGVPEAPASEPGRRLLDLIDFDPYYRPLLEGLLGDVRVVADIETAVRQASRPGNRTRFVTEDGRLVEPWGAVVLPAPRAAGLVSRRAEMALLRRDLARRELDLARSAERASTLELALEARKDEMGAVAEEVQRRTLEEEGLGLRALDLDRDAARLAERQRLVEIEIAELAATRARAAAALEAVRARLAEIGAERTGLDREMRSAEEELGGIAERVQAAEARVAQLRIASTQKEERLLSLRREETRILGEIDERRVRGRWLKDEKRRAEEREAALAREDESLAAEGAASAESETTLAARTAESERAAERSRDDLERAEEEATALRTFEDSLRDERERALVRENELGVRASAIRERLREEFQLDLAAAPLDEWRAALGDAGDDAAAWTERLRAEVESTQERLRRNASVNLEAVDELTGLEERQQHLGAQISDVEQSRAQLLAGIEALNRTSRERFQATFEAVRGHFQHLFTKVFHGGTADLSLEEGKDVLEAGVEVIARPPGKRISSLELLSGGERALTAISVLFALFRQKPSPFCLLDEVDAPLDEANTRRFIRILKEFTGNTQFIVITHSKVTMAHTERLYGITMEERGVSRRVGVRLEDAPALADVGGARRAADASRFPREEPALDGDANGRGELASLLEDAEPLPPEPRPLANPRTVG